VSKLTRVSRGFETVTSGLSKFLIGVCAVTLFAMMVIICIDVCLRYVFHSALIWSVEVSEYMLVALSVLGIAYIQAQGKHIKVEFVFDHLPPRTQMVTAIFTTIIALALFILFTISGWRIAWEAWTLNVRSWSIFKMPQFPVRVTVPIGSLVMCLYLLNELVRNIVALTKERGKSAIKS